MVAVACDSESCRVLFSEIVFLSSSSYHGELPPDTRGHMTASLASCVDVPLCPMTLDTSHLHSHLARDREAVSAEHDLQKERADDEDDAEAVGRPEELRHQLLHRDQRHVREREGVDRALELRS